MDLLLQLCAGGCYLLNKIFLALAEGVGEGRKRRLRLAGWSVYLLGVPAWVVILAGKHDWIAAAIEAGGVPAMLLGLANVVRAPTANGQRLERIAALSTYLFLAFGVGYSLYDHGGFRTLTQLLELGVMVGFLLGSYLLAKLNRNGWLCFMLMNGSMAALMWLQQQPLLTLQQLVSLGFVVYGYLQACRRHKQPRADVV